MSKLRRWTDPIDPVQAEQHFGRFIKTFTRTHRAEGDEDVTTLVSSPNRPPRRSDEATATFRHDVDAPDLAALRTRRLLGQDEVDGALAESERRRLIVELKALHRHGHIDDVVAELERARSRYPTDVELHGALADFFLEQGDLPRATEMLFALLNAFFERADLEAARRCLERIRSLDPRQSPAQELREDARPLTADRSPGCRKGDPSTLSMPE